MKNTIKHIALIIVALTLSNCSKNDDENSEPEGITIGSFYEGGVIFFIDDTGEHGLICATKDQSASILWGYNELFLNNTNENMGTGLANTEAIAAAYPDIETAARLCLDLELNGYTDWYLPSSGELNHIYLGRNIINTTAIANGGEAFKTIAEEANYWSSSEEDENRAWLKQFDTGETVSYYKTYVLNVRAIRAF